MLQINDIDGHTNRQCEMHADQMSIASTPNPSMTYLGVFPEGGRPPLEREVLGDGHQHRLVILFGFLVRCCHSRGYRALWS